MALRTEIANWLSLRELNQPANSLEQLRINVDQDIIEQQGIQMDACYQNSFLVTTEDQAQIVVRTYSPYGLEQDKLRPALVFAHGGGWCLGSLSAWDKTCRLMAESTQQVVFSVDYRLSPEFKFPVPLTDYFTALTYIYKNANLLNIDKQRISVAGDSAGANLAAAACLLARQVPDMTISHQLLFYPALDALMSSESYQIYGEGYDLTAATMEYCWNQYLTDPAERLNELVNPLMASSLVGLPAATIFVCEYDPVRGDGERYKERLLEAGVNVDFHLLSGMIHGAIHMNTICNDISDIYKKIVL